MQEANVNGVKGISNAILSHYQQGSNETKYMVSNRIIDYIHGIWLYNNYLVIISFHILI